MADSKGSSGNGCFGCLATIIFFWLVFFGGCAKMEQLIDSQIAANNAKVQQAQTASPTVAHPTSEISSTTAEVGK